MNRYLPTFAEPQWVNAIWLVLLLVVVLIGLDLRSNRALDRFLSSTMQQRLVTRPKRRWPAIVLLGLCGLFFVMALMRPQWGRQFVKTPRVGAQIMVCLDVSKSMLAEDAAPNRLERAKAEISDLLSYLQDDHVGLIAFAGKATVLCPLTPDFGFYRMVLESTGPQSVPRGGTNLEAPIREAVDGFRQGGEAAKAIILITDGEDHDTHPIDAAKAAAEKGIRIVTIGFGDEAGSPIYITDPKTNARVQVRDANGQPVATRLDGDMLRQIAMETDGAYVPAGTGVLNLKSIFNAHIAPLTRGHLEDQGRLIKREGYQWPLLGALACLLSAGYLLSRVSPPSGVVAAVCLLMLTPIARAEEKSDPRELYNQACALLTDDKLDDARQGFLDARQEARSDVKVRFRTAYNLGWVEVKQADQLLEEQPEQALEHLTRAADWFRDGVRLDPDDTAARENLEIIQRRILALADALRKKEDHDLTQRLDALIDQQRKVIGLVQGTLERVVALDSPNIPEHLRDEFKSLEQRQRAVISELSRFMQDAMNEIDQLKGVEESERTPEQSMRLAQLSNVTYFLQDGSQRLGQARRQLRQGQIERGYRRCSAGLDRMKQARDMLRDIVDVLTTLMNDTITAAQQTSGLSSKEPPPWLTNDYLKEHHEALAQRTDILVARIAAGQQASKETPPEDPKQQKAIQQLDEAAPFIGEAANRLREAVNAIDLQQPPVAYEADVEAIERFAEARELFLDVRGLIETMYAAETQMQTALQDEKVSVDEYMPMLQKLQADNIKRGERLDNLLEEELAALQTPAQQPQQPQPQPQQPTNEEAQQAQQQRYTLARQLLTELMKTFASTSTALESPEHAPIITRLGNRLLSKLGLPHKQTISKAEPLVDQGVEQIEQLRRLFFSIVEHLKETAEQQMELMDDTRDAAALDNAPAEQLSQRQTQLANISRQIAEALEKQSQQPAQPTNGGQDQTEQLREATNAVKLGVEAMDDAIGQLDIDPPAITESIEPQQIAIEKLVEAIQLLQPPQDQNQQQQQQQQQDEQQGEGQEKQEQRPQQQQQDLRHLLQSVRDRAAQRERERRQEPAGYQPVEKDW